MVTFSADDDLQGAQVLQAEMQGARFRFTDLSGSRFEQSYLSGAVMRGVDLGGADVDGNINGLTVNGVDVAPLVEAALNERFPGRSGRRSHDPGQQLRAFDAAQAQWSLVVERATADPRLRHAQVDGEWSVAQTLRHLVLATDAWLRYAVLGLDDAFCPIGLPFSEWDDKVARLGIDIAATPEWSDVLAARTDRVGQVREFLNAQTVESFAAPPRRLPPWDDDAPPEERAQMTVGRCLGVVGNEEWEHLRFTLRDLGALEPAPPG